MSLEPDQIIEKKRFFSIPSHTALLPQGHIAPLIGPAGGRTSTWQGGSRRWPLDSGSRGAHPVPRRPRQRSRSATDRRSHARAPRGQVPSSGHRKPLPRDRGARCPTPLAFDAARLRLLRTVPVSGQHRADDTTPLPSRQRPVPPCLRELWASAGPCGIDGDDSGEGPCGPSTGAHEEGAPGGGGCFSS